MYFVKAISVVIGVVFLTSCSDKQNNFFKVKNEQLSLGYTWQKLPKCRPAQSRVPTLPMISKNKQKLVCYSLVPPTNKYLTQIAKQPLANQPELSPIKTNSANNPQSGLKRNTDTSNVLWRFSN